MRSFPETDIDPKFFESDKSLGCTPTKSPKHQHFCFTTESEENGSSVCCGVYPGRSNISGGSHLKDAKHIQKVCRNAFQRCYRLLQQYPRFKERYTVQFNGDDQSIVIVNFLLKANQQFVEILYMY